MTTKTLHKKSKAQHAVVKKKQNKAGWIKVKVGDDLSVAFPAEKLPFGGDPFKGLSKSSLAKLKNTAVDLSKPPEVKREPEEAVLANDLIADVANSGPDVNALCETYKLKREELGRLTGFSLRALAEWATGKLPSQPAKRRLHEVRRLLDALAEIVKVESIPVWLHRANPAFDGLTPLQVIEVGEMDRLWAMVHDLGSGQAT